MAERSGALGVHDALRDALAVEVRHLVEEVDILQQDRAPLTDGLRRGLHADWRSISKSGDGRAALENIKELCNFSFN